MNAAEGDTLTPEEAAALRFAVDYRLWAEGRWRVVNDDGYLSVPMDQEVAERSALLWPAPADKPYRAERMQRPVLGAPDTDRSSPR